MLRIAITRWRKWQDARTRQNLMRRLGDHMLKDIGMARDWNPNSHSHLKIL